MLALEEWADGSFQASCPVPREKDTPDILFAKGESAVEALSLLVEVLLAERPAAQKEPVFEGAEFATDALEVAGFVAVAAAANSGDGNPTFVGFPSQFRDKKGDMWSYGVEPDGAVIVVQEVNYDKYTRASMVKENLDRRLGEVITSIRDQQSTLERNEEHFTRVQQQALAANAALPTGVEEDYSETKRRANAAIAELSQSENDLREKIGQLEEDMRGRETIRHRIDPKLPWEIVFRCPYTR